jgi:hypothetical protein
MDPTKFLNSRYRKAFEKLSSKNPLARMTERDRGHLIALLVLFERSLSSTDVPPFIKDLEKTHDLAEDARSMAQRMRKYVFRGFVAEARNNLLNELKVLPALLTLFADELSSLVGVMGDRGQKHKAYSNDLIVEASELVKSATKSYNDEHFVELLQYLFPDFKDQFSGDAIRKRRKRIHPERYAQARNRARSG